MPSEDRQDGTSDDPRRVLVVDDDPAVAEVAAAYIERRLHGVEAEVETSPAAALERFPADPGIDCLVSDYRMPELDGYELHERVRERRPDLPFILFSAVPRRDLDRRPDETGVTAYVEKDGSARTFAALTAAIRKAAV